MRIFQRKGSERDKAQTDPSYSQLLEKTESKYVNMTLCQPLKMGQQKERRGCSIRDKKSLGIRQTCLTWSLPHSVSSDP